MLRDRYIKWKRFLFLICFLAFAILVVYNIASQKASFFTASVVDCATILIAVAISYYLVQKQNNYQRQKDIISDMILKMQGSFEQRDLYDFSEQDKNTIMMRNRGLNNRIHILEGIAEEFNISAEVTFIRQRFDEYNNFIGNHIEDINYLRQSQNELRRPVELISQKLLAIALHLYQ